MGSYDENQTESVNGGSITITENKLLDILKKNAPEAFTEDKIDWEKFRATLGGNVEFSEERYHLNWAGKANVFRMLQRPTNATLRPCREESIKFDTSSNLFIEGENLEVLKILQKPYFGKVKMIYIDPPYNTGNDQFIYPDSFAENKNAYLKHIGKKDEQGHSIREGIFQKNNRENGHFHSNWLSMIYPRLYMARNLLRDDGVIFVSIDDNEVHNLRLVMNEIFGEDNFIACFAWRRTDNQSNIGNVARIKEYILCYAKVGSSLRLNKMKLSERARKEYRYSDDKGKYRRSILHHKTRGRFHYQVVAPNGNTVNGPWMVDESEFKKLLNNDGIHWAGKGHQHPYGKIYLKESKGQITSDFLGLEFGSNQQGSIELERLFGARYFDFPKPVSLVKHFITIGTNDDDIVMDFFAGSCTTAHAVLQLNSEEKANRRFICIQMPELCDGGSRAGKEALKACFNTIADIGKERIRKVLINSDLRDGFKVFTLQKSNFKTWRGEDIRTQQDLEKQLEIHITPLIENADTEHVLYELLLKSGLPLTSKIEDRGKWFKAEYLNTLIAFALNDIDEVIVNEVVAESPQKFIALDHLFQNNDQLKTNTSLRMEDSGIEFETV